MIALSVRQPWAWAIIHGGKDIENRQWRTNFRGRLLIHASKGVTRAEFEEAAWAIAGGYLALTTYALGQEHCVSKLRDIWRARRARGGGDRG